MKVLCRLAALPLLLAASVCAQEPTLAAAPLLRELQRVGPNPRHTYKVVDLYLRRDAVRLHLKHGTLVFLQPVAGRVTGAVFEGAGEVLVVPPARAERQQLVKFTGSPILTESFATAYFRFSDGTFTELRDQIRSGRGRPAHAPDLAERLIPLMVSLNRPHSVRLLLDFLDPPTPYFYAAIQGQRLGSFDVLVDDRRFEQVLVGQVRWWKGKRYYDVWCSFAKREGSPSPLPVRVVAHRIHATITPGRDLEALCDVDLELPRPGPRALIFELSRFLHVAEVTERAADETAEPIEFFQNATLSAEEARYRGSDVVLVVLPARTEPTPSEATSERRTLHFRYRGQVISDVGNGVLYVGARGSWYPKIDAGAPAHYELRFRLPRSLVLVATGTLRDTREESGWKKSLWVTEVPLPLAAFNVGNYESLQVTRGPVRITAYANRQREKQMALSPDQAADLSPPQPATQPLGASPTGLLEEVANDVADALVTYSELFGPFPYPELQVSQIPGTFGQGYPGLLYLSTFSFLPDVDQARMGLTERQRKLFTLLTPAHETAHQWWGNGVRFRDYRDQWLAEGLASYSAMLYLERQPGGPAVVRKWLEQYRADLLKKDEEDVPLDATGALTLGRRLDSSRSPEGYVRLIYSKAPWVLHMLRELLRDPKTGSDAVFLGGLRGLATRKDEQPLTSGGFQQQFEAALPPYADVENTGRLDWFFQQWVYDTGIPRYKLRWKLRGNPRRGWRVEGTIEQSGVPDLFTMPVPVYAQNNTELTLLGKVVVTGEKVAFRFRVKSKPDKVLLDPHQTVLFLSD